MQGITICSDYRKQQYEPSAHSTETFLTFIHYND
jgi:hypothetical protein